jgi:nicotinamidase-related amidase
VIIRKPEQTALLLVDMQNDFLHPHGAYARGGATSPAISALVGALEPVAEAARASGAWVVATQFTLVPGRHGEPFISPHLKQRRPFLKKGDFAPGSFGQALIDELSPADLSVEKIAYSAFYMSRLEWLLRRAGITHLVVGGIVTDGGVASTVRDAHVRDFRISVLEDGCAVLEQRLHDHNIAALSGIAEITSCADFVHALVNR